MTDNMKDLKKSMDDLMTSTQSRLSHGPVTVQSRPSHG